jgi:uncharacterized protein YneF (UPF0154 family)
MKTKTIVLTVALFALIVVGMFIYTKLKNVELNEAVSLEF